MLIIKNLQLKHYGGDDDGGEQKEHFQKNMHKEQLQQHKEQLIIFSL